MTATLTADPAAAPSLPAPLPGPLEVLTWLRDGCQRNVAPFRPPAKRLVDSMEDGELLWSSYGRGIALVFSGTPTFIAQWEAWAVNTGVLPSGARMRWYEAGYRGSCAYICPRDKETVRRGLATQFGWEIVRFRETPVSRHIDPETEEPVVEWDERAVEERASQLADWFVRTHIRTSGIVLGREESFGEVLPFPRFQSLGQAAAE